MVDYDSKNEAISLCNLKKLEAIHDLLLILQNLIEFSTLQRLGWGGGGRGEFVETLLNV